MKKDLLRYLKKGTCAECFEDGDVFAWHISEENGTYLCPTCMRDAVLEYEYFDPDAKFKLKQN